MNAAVAIFVKTPGFSPIKTRLGKHVGRAMAEEWHRRAAACVAESARQSGLPAYWAVAEPEAIDHSLWRDLPRLVQPPGSLGRRMAGIHSELQRRHGSAILVGADLPQLQPRHLSDACIWLAADSPRRVLGPARDGGFWLFGANDSIPQTVWESVGYSREDTASRFIEAVGGEAWAMLETLTDLDQADDLPLVLRELTGIHTASDCHHELTSWLTEWIRQTT